MARRSLFASAAPQPRDIPVSTTEHDDPELAAALATAPRYVDRKRAAEMITRLYFPINHRTLERWPIAGRHVGGYFVMPTADVLAEARRRFDAAPVIRGGKGAPR
jgi:hypothetical protein